MNTTPSISLPFEIERHCLELRYESLRIHSLKAKRRLLLSIHEHGLRVPITVIPAEQTTRFIVIDGYLRLAVLRELQQDHVTAHLWSMTAEEALIYSYTQNKARAWDSMEEATLLQELITHHDYTQEKLSKVLAKSRSWVVRRLQLIHELPCYAKEAIYQGVLSSWNAIRVILPLARANESHAKELVQYLSAHNRSTRECRDFYEHYLRSHRLVRQQMISQPELFFKAQRVSTATENLLPEEQFEKKLRQVTHILKAVKPLLPAVFYREQSMAERHDLEKKWRCAEQVVNELKETIEELTRYDTESDKRDTANTSTAGEEHS